MKKRIILVVIVVAILLLLIPIPFYLNDGGSIEFRALLYTVTNYNKLMSLEDGYKEGIKIEILGKEVYNNIQPNEDELERNSADKIRINYGTDHIDYLYGIGRKVIINYSGAIKETYPAQIDTNNILIDGYEEFELNVKTSKDRNKIKVLNNKELNKNDIDYNLYYYGLDEVTITIKDKTITLEEALRSGKMTINGLIIKANKDFPNAQVYKDGGSMEYHYDNYTIIKMHKVNGNRDVYIGTKDMTINNVE